MANAIIQMQGIRKSFFIGKPNELEVLHGIDLTVNEGEFLAIVGESGSGKSTLMNIIGALDKCTEGSYSLDGTDINSAGDKELSAIRNRQVGFVFQTFNLIGKTRLKTLNCQCSTAAFQKGSAQRAQRSCLLRSV